MKKGLLICGIVSLFFWNCYCVIAAGLAEVRPYNQTYTDIVELRYTFKVETNTSNALKIIFGSTRLRGTGNADTYIIEGNYYTGGLRYTDPVCVFWPMQGTIKPAEASFRIAVPDYNKKDKFGMKTYQPLFFPRQTYEIDGITDLWKTDAITQMNMNGVVGSLRIMKSQIIVDKTGWKCNGVPLSSENYSKWNIYLTIGSTTYMVVVAFPDSSAAYMVANEILALYTEFMNTTGLFKAYFWDIKVRRENQTTWIPLNTWKILRYDGNGSNFGVKVTPYNGFNSIEVSNTGGTYLPTGFIFSL